MIELQMAPPLDEVVMVVATWLLTLQEQRRRPVPSLRVVVESRTLNLQQQPFQTASSFLMRSWSTQEIEA